MMVKCSWLVIMNWSYGPYLRVHTFQSIFIELNAQNVDCGINASNLVQLILIHSHTLATWPFVKCAHAHKCHEYWVLAAISINNSKKCQIQFGRAFLVMQWILFNCSIHRAVKHVGGACIAYTSLLSRFQNFEVFSVLEHFWLWRFVSEEWCKEQMNFLLCAHWMCCVHDHQLCHSVYIHFCLYGSCCNYTCFQ